MSPWNGRVCFVVVCLFQALSSEWLLLWSLRAERSNLVHAAPARVLFLRPQYFIILLWFSYDLGILKEERQQ